MPASRHILATLAITLLFTGCLGDPTAPSTTIWHAELVPQSPVTTVEADMAAISRIRTIETGITLTGGVPGATYSWSLNAGTCDEIGSSLANAETFGSLAADADGEGSTETSFLGTLRDSSNYVGVVRGEDGTVEACGPLRPDESFNA